MSYSNEDPKIELILSRSCYNIGDTVVGTIRLIPGNARTHKNHPSQLLVSRTNDFETNPTSSDKSSSAVNNYLFSPFTDAIIYVAGKCKLDPRWHNITKVKDLYETHPILNNLPIPPQQQQQEQNDNQKQQTTESLSHSQTVCFFATNFVSLLDLPNIKIAEYLKSTPEGPCRKSYAGFTFRVDLPLDIPPSVPTLCCRYFYYAVASARLITGKTISIQIPFMLQSSAHVSRNPHSNIRTIYLHQQPHDTSHTRIKIGQCVATPHLPPPPSPLMLTHRSQIAVSRTSGLCSTTSTADIRSVRVTNQKGIPCCILTIVGAKIMAPGGKLLLQFHFEPEIVFGKHTKINYDEEQGENNNNNEILSCLQIGTCLYGEELAVYSNENDGKNKTRSFIFDTAHSLIEPGSVETHAMTLTLPLDCPCSLKTDLAQMNIYCKIELTVEERKSGRKKQGKHKFETLRLELPCDVVQNLVEVEEPGGEEIELPPTEVFAIAAQEKIKFTQENGENASNLKENNDVLRKDILGDLTMLSMRLVDSGVLINT